ncbi:MAG: hypothetical protein DI537_10305 [Stutzerimonas stutzeri]|nr:MAG: hypothetical protein DI537_10305 [Stutzerimonas stutzeri]
MTLPFVHRIPSELDQDRAQKLAERHAGNPFIASANWGAVQYALDIIGKEFGENPTKAVLIVEQHVLCNVSRLVALLSEADYEHGADPLGSLMDQAEPLAKGISHYEAAARAAGWSEGTQIHRIDNDDEIIVADSWADACEQDDLEVEVTEIHQFWAVSPWLARALTARGQKVYWGFAGMHVWARTETNPLISSDQTILAVAEAEALPEPPPKG